MVVVCMTLCLTMGRINEMLLSIIANIQHQNVSMIIKIKWNWFNSIENIQTTACGWLKTVPPSEQEQQMNRKRKVEHTLTQNVRHVCHSNMFSKKKKITLHFFLKFFQTDYFQKANMLGFGISLTEANPAWWVKQKWKWYLSIATVTMRGWSLANGEKGKNLLFIYNHCTLVQLYL